MKKYIGTFRKATFSVMILLLPGSVHAQFFDASLPGKKMTLQQCLIWLNSRISRFRQGEKR